MAVAGGSHLALISGHIIQPDVEGVPDGAVPGQHRRQSDLVITDLFRIDFDRQIAFGFGEMGTIEGKNESGQLFFLRSPPIGKLVVVIPGPDTELYMISRRPADI